MTASLLLVTIGLADLLRRGRRRPIGWTLVALLWVAMAALGAVVLGSAPWEIALVIVASAGWVALMPITDWGAPRRFWPVPVLAILVAAISLVSHEAGPVGEPLVSEPLAAGLVRGGITLDAIMAVFAVAVFLCTSANVVVRAALRRADDDLEVIAARRSWQLRIRGRAIGEIAEPERQNAAVSTLKGGRLIGPIERLLIVVLALTGAFVLIAALVAAKGVVRFPEISDDRGIGSKAEEFLIGSLASWSIAAFAALYLAAVFSL